MAFADDAFPARPAIVSALAALALHLAIVAALPRAHRARALELWPHALEVDFTEPPPIALPPPPAPALPAPEPVTTARSHAPTIVAPRAPAPTPAPTTARENEPRTVSENEPRTVSENEPRTVSHGADGPGPDHQGPSLLPRSGGGPPGRSGPSGPPSAAAVPANTVDHSRAAALAHGRNWQCPWPDEAEQVDEALVVVTVVVDAAGRATRVDIVDDPGHGFAREARRCALREVYTPALDRDGRPSTAVSKPIRIRSSR